MKDTKMGKMQVRKSLLTATLMILVSIMILPSASSSASAWNLNWEQQPPFSWPTNCSYPAGTTKVYWKNMNLDFDYYEQVKKAVILWNNAGHNIKFIETSENMMPRVEISEYFDSNDNNFGFVPGVQCSSNVVIAHLVLKLNRWKIGSNMDLALHVATHELGHVLKLGHPAASNGQNLLGALMRQGPGTDVIAPTLDDIRGAQTIWGKKPLTVMHTTPMTNNGIVEYAVGSDTTTTTLRVTSATDSSYAYAREGPLSTILPHDRILLMSANVTANTLNNFVLGVFTGTDFKDRSQRFLSIEVNEGGFDLIATASPNGIDIDTIGWNVVQGETYFIILVIRDGTLGETSRAYVFKNDGGHGEVPTYIGTASVTTSFTWDTPVYYGAGVWTDSSGEPLSNYSVKDYRNQKESAVYGADMNLAIRPRSQVNYWLETQYGQVVWGTSYNGQFAQGGVYANKTYKLMASTWLNPIAVDLSTTYMHGVELANDHLYKIKYKPNHEVNGQCVDHSWAYADNNGSTAYPPNSFESFELNDIRDYCNDQQTGVTTIVAKIADISFESIDIPPTVTVSKGSPEFTPLIYDDCCIYLRLEVDVNVNNPGWNKITLIRHYSWTYQGNTWDGYDSSYTTRASGLLSGDITLSQWYNRYYQYHVYYTVQYKDVTGATVSYNTPSVTFNVQT